MILIIAGNPNIYNIRNVVYFSNKYYDNKIERIHFIDTEASIINEGESIEGKRNSKIRQYLPKVSIESSVHEKEELHIDIPRILSEKLKVFPNITAS